MLTRLADLGRRVIVTTHPRTRKRLEAEQVALPSAVELHKPFGFSDYVHLKCRRGRSCRTAAPLPKKSSILNFPALNIRQAHERPEGMEEAAVMLVGLEWPRVAEGLAVLDIQARGEARTLRLVADYAVPNVSEKVVRIILSYTDYVNRVVWQKHLSAQ